MKKFINDPNTFVEESLDGVLSAYPSFYAVNPADHKAVVLREHLNADRVSIVTGGGAGHLPLFLGYVGEGLCAGAAIGNVFSTPSAETIDWVVDHVPNREGIVFIIGNYTGDIMNFEIAARKAQDKGIRTRTVIISDDVATAPKAEWRNRRCIGGIVLAFKAAGAAARAGEPLEKVAEVAEQVNRNLASVGVAFSPCQLPNTRTPVFSIGEDEMELGVGIHGETGVRRSKLMKSREIADFMISRIAQDQELKAGERVAVLVNGLGAASQEELYILYRDLKNDLDAREIGVHRLYIGNYSTSLGMNGASVSILRLDDALVSLLDAETFSPLVRF